MSKKVLSDVALRNIKDSIYRRLWISPVSERGLVDSVFHSTGRQIRKDRIRRVIRDMAKRAMFTTIILKRRGQNQYKPGLRQLQYVHPNYQVAIQTMPGT